MSKSKERPSEREYTVGMLPAKVAQALLTVSEQAARLRRSLRHDWPGPTEQAVHRLRFNDAGPTIPAFAALVGGASSGKTTVFNNLLAGHLASRVTARGHATLGPILAVHEVHRARLDTLLMERRLLPGFEPRAIELDENATGEPNVLSIVFHSVDELRDVFLFDLPDFTSEAAAQEGDIALSLLPWFDRLIVVVDHERWFDRQSISQLRAASAPLAQQRWVLFNRTREGELNEEDRNALAEQSRQLAAVGMTILEFRRGRGFCRFAPGTLSEVGAFLSPAPPERSSALLTVVAAAANQVLNQNEERLHRLRRLRASLDAAVRRSLPTSRDCILAMMTPDERRQLSVAARVLRLEASRRWLMDQAQRLQTFLGQVPLIGTVLGNRLQQQKDGLASAAGEASDRRAIGLSFAREVRRRCLHDLRRLIRTSAFWDELRRWTGLEPTESIVDWEAEQPSERLEATIAAFDRAVERWNRRIEREFEGISPNIKGALSFGAIGLAIVLVAAPGPLAALTLVTAKTAIGAALTHLLAAAGAGAVLAKYAGRLAAVVEEKLMGSEEFDAVIAAAMDIRSALETQCVLDMKAALREAEALVLRSDDPLAQALEALRGAARAMEKSRSKSERRA